MGQKAHTMKPKVVAPRFGHENAYPFHEDEGARKAYVSQEACNILIHLK